MTLAEDGSAKFVYTPYENKTGKDSFTYVAIDSAGNTSSEAKVTIQINKPDTKVTYADMEGDPAHKAPSAWPRRASSSVPISTGSTSLTPTARSPEQNFSPWPWPPSAWLLWKM